MDMAEIEFEVPGFHGPCRTSVWEDGSSGYCMSLTRIIRHVPKNMGKMLLCGNGHNQLGDKPFIPGYEFDVGGAYEGIVLPEFLPSGQSLRRSRWKIPADAAIFEIDDETCVDCGVPTSDFYAGPDIRTAWPWLEAHAPELIAEVHQQVARIRGASLQDWPSLIDDDLRRRIRERMDKSRLDIDHSIPKAIGDEMWPLLIDQERKVLQLTLLVRLCKKCNMSKSKKLLARETIEQWYVATYFDGNRAAAIADAPRWALVDRVLTKIYDRKAVG